MGANASSYINQKNVHFKMKNVRRIPTFYPDTIPKLPWIYHPNP